MELYEKIEAALVFYLSQFIDGDPATLPPNTDIPVAWLWPKSLQNDVGELRIFEGETDNVKDGQAILCIADDANQEDPQFTGNQMVPCQVWLRTPVKVLTPKEVELKMPTALANHELAAAILSDAMNQDPFLLAGYLNASAQDMTIMGGVMDLRPQRQEHPNWFGSGWTFRVYAMNKTAP